MNNLTPKLTPSQIKANIDVLLKAGKDTNTVQGYVNNYRKDSDGNYILASIAEKNKQSDTIQDVKEGVSNLTQSLERRADKIQEAKVARKKGEQSLARTAFQQFGQGVGAAADVIGETVMTAGKVLLPKGVEEKISGAFGKGTESLAKIPMVQDIVGKYEEIQKTNPALARDIDAALGISGLITELYGGGVASKAASKTAKATANIASDTASSIQKSALKTIKTAQKNLTPKSTVPIHIDAITPNVGQINKKEYVKLVRQGKISPKTTIKPAEYIMSPDEIRVGDKYKDLLTSRDPVNNTNNVMSKVRDYDRQVENFLEKNNKSFAKSDLVPFLRSKIDDIDDLTVDERRLSKLKDSIVNNFVKSISTYDTKNLWKARKEFDRSIEKAFTGSPSLQKDMQREFRNAVQEFISEQTDNVTYKSYMKDMSELLKLADTISNKAALEKGNSVIQNWIRNNPNKAKLIGGALGSGLLVTAVGAALE